MDSDPYLLDCMSLVEVTRFNKKTKQIEANSTEE